LPIRRTFLGLDEGVYIPFGLQSFGESIAQRSDLLFSAMEIHLVRFDLGFQMLALDRPGLPSKAVSVLRKMT
jgi:hypothetical protein